ncbi:MAG TPA: heavy-metal-associated domain-containing protein [Syntrophomonadaceae bacterium]|nr:heavy-metal-associated domain-containing protein [Syntrophomonadaceae bacterium]
MHFINTIRNSVKRLPGIIRTDVNPQGKHVAVTYEDDQVTVAEIKHRIEAVGCRIVGS